MLAVQNEKNNETKGDELTNTGNAHTESMVRKLREFDFPLAHQIADGLSEQKVTDADFRQLVDLCGCGRRFLASTEGFISLLELLYKLDQLEELRLKMLAFDVDIEDTEIAGVWHVIFGSY